MPRLLAKIVVIDPQNIDSAALEPVAKGIIARQLAAFPTETVYGLGADAFNSLAVAAIFAAKQRPMTDPVIVHIADMDDIAAVTDVSWQDLPPNALQLAQKFWPGPLTMILPRGARVPLVATAGKDTVAVRMPSHPVARALIRMAGVPLAAPSANRFGHISPTTAQHVADDLGTRIAWIVDGGPSQVGVESTIVDVTTSQPTLLRPGGVSAEELEAVLGEKLARPERFAVQANEAAPAPGMLLSHYAPEAKLLVFHHKHIDLAWRAALQEIAAQTKISRRVGALAPQEYLQQALAAGAAEAAVFGAVGDAALAAQSLYAGLRALDKAQVSLIVTAIGQTDGIALALQDRLWRAAGGIMLEVENDD